MLKSLYHRGPDEQGEYLDNNISLGIRRLSIIDLKTGSQPLFNEDRSLVVVCNGEIYNFYELRNNLIKKGHNFYTNSDAEAIVHLYEIYGTECVKYLKGMFSFALWDKNKKNLFIVRDRFGIKPLYYYNNNGIFAFSSELKALLKLPFVEKKMNIQALSLYFSLGYTPSTCSIFKGIYKLEPAHYILHKNNSIEINRYWSLRDININNKISFYDAKEKFKGLLRHSVKEHLISDVPLGIFLSGGIDSSTLASFAKEINNQDVSTFSIGFKEKSFDESKYAFLASKYFDTKHYSRIFTSDDFISIFRDVITFLDEPLADFTIFPTYFLSKFSRQHIKVALSGEGADELFMGYPTYNAHRYMQLFDKLPQGVKRLTGYLINLLPASFDYFSLDFKLKQFTQGINQTNPLLRHLKWMGVFLDNEKSMLFSENLKDSLSQNRDLIDDFLGDNIKDLDEVEIYKHIQYLDITTYLSDNLFVKADRAGMFSSLEIRVPYLDHGLVEFLYSLPTAYIFQKRLLKESVKHKIPMNILKRSKKGFAVPVSYWLDNKKLFHVFKEVFDSNFVERQGFFNHSYIKKLLSDHTSHRENNARKLETYIMFQFWYKKYIEGEMS